MLGMNARYRLNELRFDDERVGTARTLGRYAIVIAWICRGIHIDIVRIASWFVRNHADWCHQRLNDREIPHLQRRFSSSVKRVVVVDACYALKVAYWLHCACAVMEVPATNRLIRT